MTDQSAEGQTATAPPWAPLASRAFQAAVRDDMWVAARLAERISNEHGADCLVFAVLAWVDNLWQFVQKPSPEHGIGFQEATTGRVDGVDDVPPQVAWTARFITARARGDEDMVEALIYSVPDDGQWARNVQALLSSIGLMVRAALAERQAT
jgi:hypothetical protein